MKNWEHTILTVHDGASIWRPSLAGHCAYWRYSCNQISWMYCAMPGACVLCIEHYMQLNLHEKFQPINPIYQYTNPQLLSLMLFFPGHSKYMCNFGPKDKSSIVPHDMQVLLKSTQKKKQKMLQKKKTREEGCPGIRVFPYDQINPSKGKSHWQDISQKFHEARVPTLLCCEEAILGPLAMFAHLWKYRTLECRWRTLLWYHGQWI